MGESQTEQSGQTEQTGRSARAEAAPWFRRVLPVTGLALAFVAVAALAMPSFRDEIAVSTTRQPQPYVELYFSQFRPIEAMCGRQGQVRFVVVSHLEETRRLAYRTVVAAADGEQRTTRGAVRIEPGQTRPVRAQLLTPTNQDYTVTVQLPALDQLVRAHCSGSAS